MADKEKYHMTITEQKKNQPGGGQSNSSERSGQSADPSHFLDRGMQDWSLHSNSLLEHLGAERKTPTVTNFQKKSL
jgi:hypothetical protein